MRLIVKGKFQVMNLSGGRAKLHDLEPGTYPGRVGPPPQDHDITNSWFYLNGHNAVGAALNYLRGQSKDLAELIEA